MRIGILSDLHVDINQEAGKPVMEGLKAAIKNRAIDKMIIAGDLAEVVRAREEPGESVRYRGKPAVMMAIMKKESANMPAETDLSFSVK